MSVGRRTRRDAMKGMTPMVPNGAIQRPGAPVVQQLPFITIISNPEKANDDNPNGIGIGTNFTQAHKAMMICMLTEAIAILAQDLGGKSSTVVMPDGSPAPLPPTDSTLAPEPTPEQQASA